MEFGPAQRRGERGAEGAGAAAQVDDDRSGTGEGGGLPDQELGAAAGYEDAGADGDPQAVELGPAEDVFQGKPGDPPFDHGGDRGGTGGGGEDQFRLVLGEYAAAWRGARGRWWRG